MSRAHSFLKAVIGLSLAALLGLLLVALNALQVLSLLLHPLWPYATRRFNREIANTWWGLCVLLGTRVLGYEVLITENASGDASTDAVPDGENALVFANHQEMPDIFVLMVYARSKKRLGDLKFFVKDPLKYVPGIGWGMWMLDCVFLKRSWADDEQRIRATFHKFTSMRIPFWLTFFPEGTRIRPAKLASSQKYARQKGLPILEHVLTPRTKGFTAAMKGLRSQAHAVYDLTIVYEGEVPSLLHVLTGKARRASLHVERFPIAALPESEPELARWLTERFIKKDHLLDELSADATGEQALKALD
ncbi:MAG: hypothetical protein A2X94_01655 [Bdellovibrionales bacterium GWB1_55_8]|nr:MAG: hypothetical protein A2X94_01655 [Bdellovibrionales bacterium GWB1_55_8]